MEKLTMIGFFPNRECVQSSGTTFAHELPIPDLTGNFTDFSQDTVFQINQAIGTVMAWTGRNQTIPSVAVVGDPRLLAAVENRLIQRNGSRFTPEYLTEEAQKFTQGVIVRFDEQGNVIEGE